LLLIEIQHLQSSDLITFVTEKIEDMKGRDLVTLDVSKKSGFTDCMLVCSGNSKRHVISIAKSLVIECRTAGLEALGVEGADIGEWALVDLGDVVVHVMTDEIRDRYQLEQLWE
jgi:ribosome-associated protein